MISSCQLVSYKSGTCLDKPEAWIILLNSTISSLGVAIDTTNPENATEFCLKC